MITSHSDSLRDAMLSNLAMQLAHDAADALEPLAGQPISDELRAALAADVCTALGRCVPQLVNVRHGLDAAG